MSSNCNNVVSPVLLYSTSFVGTLKNEILGAALELCQLKIEHFSPGILKFNTKHKDNPFTLNCSTVFRTFLFIFRAGSRGLGSKKFRNSSYKEKSASSARVSRLYLSVSYDYVFIKIHQTIYKNSINVKTCIDRGFEFFKENPFVKKSVEQPQNKRVYKQT